MKLIYLKHILVAWLLISSAGVHAQTQAHPFAALSLLPWDFLQPEPVEIKVANAGYTHATIYVPWADVEIESGKFNFDKFDGWIQRLKDQGLASMITLDFGGLSLFRDDGTLDEHTVVPEWFLKKYPDAEMHDFSGKTVFQLQFDHPAVRKYAGRFVDQAVAHFSKQHKDAIFGYAVGLQEEHEIKFGQQGYHWRDYSPATQSDFKAAYGAPMPVINYNNEIAQGTPRQEILLPAHQAFREERLRDATCYYADIIRRRNQTAMAYFGELFTTHDAIYATGVVEHLADCLDAAVIDYNFYDGYRLRASPDTLPLMANFMASTGFKNIFVGAYAERWFDAGKGQELLPVIEKSLTKALVNPAVIGYEIGGFQKPTKDGQQLTLDFDTLKRLRVLSRPTEIAQNKRIKLGLFASTSNYYFWHGEQSNGRNIHQDALTEAYTLLSNDPHIDVAVFGEKMLSNTAFMQSLDIVMVPHQSALPPAVKDQLRDYWSAGGVLVQDLRLGDFNNDGQLTSDWLNDVFGIKGFRWSQLPGHFLYEGKKIELDLLGKSYFNHALLQGKPGYRLAAKAIEVRDQSGMFGFLRRLVFGKPSPQVSPNNGLILIGERSLAFGFLPQLAEGPSASDWHKIFLSEIISLADKSARNKSITDNIPTTQ